MNRFFQEKFIAFTLAEMMVILALFSTIAAATLPVVTARRALDVSELATGGSTLDPWTYSSAYNGISYYNSQSSLIATSAVMVGGQVSADAKSIGYPQLIVKDNYGVSGKNFGKHIVFLKRSSNNNTYLGGSIMMGNSGEGSIAIGSNAMSNASGIPDGYYSLDTRPYSVAIGSYAMRNGPSGSISTSSVAIGYSNINYQGNNTVAIGYENCSGGATNYDVCIGSNSGHVKSFSVAIGKNAANNTSGNHAVAIGALSGSSGTNGTAIGYYSGNSGSVYGINIGSYAGYASNANNSVLLGNRTQTKSSESVVIGNYATAYSSNSNRSNAVVMGSYAGYNFDYKGTEPILIGSYAGASLNTLSISVANSVYPVIIGYRAGANEGGGPSPYLADVAIGTNAGLVGHGNNVCNYGSTFIGNYAGHVSKAKRSVCIGNSTCAVNSSESVVRIAPYGYYFAHSKTLGEYASHIGMPTMLENLDSANKEKFLGNSYSNMLITPAITSSDLATSSILFYANTVYGPSTTFTSFSDKRLKENIKPAKYGLNDIKKINIYEYNLKDESLKKRQIGVIAQEMKEVIPEGVKQLPSGYYTVSADWLIFPMVNAIKELDKTFVSLKSDLTKYFNEYIVLVSRVKTLEKEVKTLERENKSLTKEVSIAYKKAKLAERRQ